MFAPYLKDGVLGKIRQQISKSNQLAAGSIFDFSKESEEVVRQVTGHEDGGRDQVYAIFLRESSSY
jgi:hypothetical protein